MRIVSNPKSEIEAICNVVLARLNSGEPIERWQWVLIESQLKAGARIAKAAKETV